MTRLWRTEVGRVRIDDDSLGYALLRQNVAVHLFERDLVGPSDVRLLLIEKFLDFGSCVLAAHNWLFKIDHRAQIHCAAPRCTEMIAG